MSVNWSPQRLKRASLGLASGRYEATPTTPEMIDAKKRNPDLFKFDAVSIGDEGGQAFIVPLDESSLQTAMYILRAIAAYQGE